MKYLFIILLFGACNTGEKQTQYIPATGTADSALIETHFELPPDTVYIRDTVYIEKRDTVYLKVDKLVIGGD